MGEDIQQSGRAAGEVEPTVTEHHTGASGVAGTQRGASKTMHSRNLTPKQQATVEVWERHLAAELKEKDVDAMHHLCFGRNYVFL